MGNIARLHSAVLTYARDFMINKGFTYCIPPFMIRSDVVTGVMSFAARSKTGVFAFKQLVSFSKAVLNPLMYKPLSLKHLSHYNPYCLSSSFVNWFHNQIFISE